MNGERREYRDGYRAVHANRSNRYHYKCLKIARGKVKEDEKYTCPICDWRMKIPRDAARPRLEELKALAKEMESLPFQPDEEEVLLAIINNAQDFRDHIASRCGPSVTSESEAEKQRFYLRKLEGAEVLLALETNVFRGELHRWWQVAPEPPPLSEKSLSTRKPRPTKLQKMLVEYGVDNPDDLPEHAKGKANSLRRKAANAEAAAAAASGASASSLVGLPGSSGAFGGSSFDPRTSHSARSSMTAPSHGHPDRAGSSEGTRPSLDPMDIDSSIHPGLLGVGGPQLVDNSTMSLEERLLQGQEDGINLHTEANKSKALEIFGRTEDGRKQAEKIWGPDVWGPTRRSMSDHRSMTPGDVNDMIKPDEGNVDQMFKDMTNQDDEDEQKKKDSADGAVTAESLESERNGMDALLDGD